MACTVPGKNSQNRGAQRVLNEVHQIFQTLPFADKYSLVPTENFHVTVLGILNFFDQRSSKTYSLEWPKAIPKDQTLEKTDAAAVALYSQISTESFTPFYFQTNPLDFIGTATGSQSIILNPKTEEDASRLLTFRQTLCDLFGLDLSKKKPRLHISLGYLLRKLSPQEELYFDENALPKIRTLLESFDTLVCDHPQLMFFDNIFHLESHRSS